MGEPTNKKVTIRPEHRSVPELRKLARALLSLARVQLDVVEAKDAPSPPGEGTK